MDEPECCRIDAVAQSAGLARAIGKTWPRWLSPPLERTSVRVMPWLVSRFSTTFSGSIGLVKLGQPELLSNLLIEANSGSPETTST